MNGIAVSKTELYWVQRTQPLKHCTSIDSILIWHYALRQSEDIELQSHDELGINSDTSDMFTAVFKKVLALTIH